MIKQLIQTTVGLYLKRTFLKNLILIQVIYKDSTTYYIPSKPQDTLNITINGIAFSTIVSAITHIFEICQVTFDTKIFTYGSFVMWHYIVGVKNIE